MSHPDPPPPKVPVWQLRRRSVQLGDGVANSIETQLDPDVSSGAFFDDLFRSMSRDTYDDLCRFFDLIKEHCEKLFAGLNFRGSLDICKNMEYQRMAPGAIVIRKGDEALHYYFVLAGDVDVMAAGIDDGGGKPGSPASDDAVFTTIDAGRGFGELAFFTGNARNATCKAGRNGCCVVSVPKEVYMKEFFKIHKSKFGISNKLSFMKKMAIFKTWQHQDLVRLSYTAEDRTAKATSMLVKEGKLLDELFCIVKGTVRVTQSIQVRRNTFQQSCVVATLGPQECFGFEPFDWEDILRKSTANANAASSGKGRPSDHGDSGGDFSMHDFAGSAARRGSGKVGEASDMPRVNYSTRATTNVMALSDCQFLVIRMKNIVPVAQKYVQCLELFQHVADVRIDWARSVCTAYAKHKCNDLTITESVLARIGYLIGPDQHMKTSKGKAIVRGQNVVKRQFYARIKEGRRMYKKGMLLMKQSTHREALEILKLALAEVQAAQEMAKKYKYRELEQAVGYAGTIKNAVSDATIELLQADGDRLKRERMTLLAEFVPVESPKEMHRKKKMWKSETRYHRLKTRTMRPLREDIERNIHGGPVIEVVGGGIDEV
eukprot:g5455.t1